MISVYKGDYGECALLVTHSGELYAVGNSSKGCLGLEDVTETKEPLQLQGITGVAGVSVCGYFGDALAYTKEGKVYAWGENVQCESPTVIKDLTDIVDARCVYGHYLALSKTGKVYEWRGVNYSDYRLQTLSRTPKLRSIGEEVVVAIACGFDHSLALTDNGDEDDEPGAPKHVQTSFTLKLIKFDEKQKVALIKEVKNLLEGMNLVQAKKFVESAPTVVKADIQKDEAEKLKEALSKVGGRIGDCII